MDNPKGYLEHGLDVAPHAQVRFSHPRNTWQTRFLGSVTWIDAPVDLIRGYVDEGAEIVIGPTPTERALAVLQGAIDREAMRKQVRYGHGYHIKPYGHDELNERLDRELGLNKTRT